MPGSSRSHGLYQAHVIHLTPEAKDAFLAQLRSAAEHLQHEGDEFVLNAIECPGLDGQHKLTLKLTMPAAPARSWLNKDVIIASAIAIGCITLIAMAFIAPHPKDTSDDAQPVESASQPVIVPGTEHPTPAQPR